MRLFNFSYFMFYFFYNYNGNSYTDKKDHLHIDPIPIQYKAVLPSIGHETSLSLKGST